MTHVKPFSRQFYHLFHALLCVNEVMSFAILSDRVKTEITLATMSGRVFDMFNSNQRREISIEDEHVRENAPSVTSLADSLSPLLTSMKFFGMYFKRRTDDGGSNTSSGRWNLAVIYAVLVLTAMWLNVFRLFSAFMEITLAT